MNTSKEEGKIVTLGSDESVHKNTSDRSSGAEYAQSFLSMSEESVSAKAAGTSPAYANILLNLLFSMLLGCLFYVTSSAWFDKHHAMGLCYALSVFPLFICVIVTLTKLHCGNEIQNPWIATHSLLMVTMYAAIATLLYTAWFQGDDFACTGTANILRDYMNRISRIGEIICHSWVLGVDRWQVWIINPLLAVTFPLAVWRLLGNSWKSYWSLSGFLFSIFIVPLLLMSCRVENYWRNWWCYAASCNYLWPSIATVWLLSAYNPKNWNKNGDRAKLICLWLVLGVFCGWGQEAGTVILLPALVIWMVVRVYKKYYIPGHCLAGFVGVLLGACLLFASPALNNRVLGSLSIRKIDPGQLSLEELSDFLHNLTSANLSLLRGDGGNIVLEGISYLDRLYFVPHLSQIFWKCSVIPTCVCCALLLCLCCTLKKPQLLKTWGISLSCIALAWVSAFSYMAGCIPGHMSYLVSCFIILLVCACLYQKIVHTVIKSLFSLCIIAYACWLFVPAGINAWHNKKYEQQLHSDIIKQRKSGKQEIIVQMPIFDKRDTLGLSNSMPFGGLPGSSRWRNGAAAKFFRVKSITIIPQNPSK